MPEYRKILLSCTFAIGDVVMATSAAALLKKIYPTAYIAMIIKPLAEEIVRNHPMIDEMISPKYQQKKLSLEAMRGSLAEIQRQKYDLFISLDGKLRPALLAALAGIPKRVGPTTMFGSNTRMPLLLTDVVDVGDFKTTHYTEVLRQLVAFVTDSKEAASPILPKVLPETELAVKELLSMLPPDTKRIGLCVRTNERKTWPANKFIELIDRIHEKYKASFFIVGSDGDRLYADQICQQTQAQVENFCGKTDLVGLIGLLKETHLFITLDTAPMHIGSALNIPLVAIFGCTAPESVAPLAQKAIVVKPPALECIPCIPLRVAVLPGISRRTGPKECPGHECMESVTVDMVLEAVTQQQQWF